MTFELSFVDAISSTANTRLSLYLNGGWKALAKGTDFGLPSLRRAVASNLLTEGEHVPAAAYGNRIITLALDATDLELDAAATQIQLLSRELERSQNILRYRAGTTEPVFFRTLRSDFAGVAWDADLRRATVTLLAEPFAYGLKKTLSSVTVNNDPAAGSNGCYFDIAAADAWGDVETPLNLKVTRSESSPPFSGIVTCVAVRRRGTPSAAPFVLQAETMDAWTDTSIQANSATFSGAGSNYMRTTFATVTAMATRLASNLFPAAASADSRGTYRVFARVRKTVTSDQFNIGLGYGASTSSGYDTVLNDTTTLPVGSTSPFWVDLGLLSIPVGADPVYDGYSNTQVAVGGIGFSLRAQRVSGTGNLDWDVVLFMPADDRMAFIEYASISAGALDYEILDSVHDRVWTMEGGATFSTGVATSGSHVGGLPVITPGVLNRICWLLNGSADSAVDSLAYTTTIEPYYWPRYLYVRPVGT